MLGNKGAECFAWSGAHDDDAEFRRRYAATPERVAFMLTWHRDDATTQAARERLESLT